MMSRYVALYFLLGILISPGCLEPLIIGENDTFIVDEGSNLELKCIFGPNSTFNVPVENSTFIITSNWTASDGIFYRPDATTADTGWYSCAPQGVVVDPNNHEQPNTSRSYIYVKSEENLIASSYNLLTITGIYGGTTIIIPCRPSSPEYTMKFYQQDNELTLPNISFNPRLGFIWENISIYDSGSEYTCIAEHNNTTQPVRFVLSVSSKVFFNTPQIINDTIQHVIQGQDLTVNCTLDVNKLVQFTLEWILPKNSSRIYQKADEKIIGDIRRFIRTMIIKNVSYEDEGKYECRVYNGDSQKSDYRVIKIHDPTMTHINLKAQGGVTEFAAAEGDNMSCVVYVDAYPEPTLRWIGPNGKEIINSAKYNITRMPNLMVFKIKKLEAKDTGIYNLVASNPNKIITLNITLEVESQPVAIIQPIQSYYKPGSLAQIVCHVASYPKANVSWLFIHCPDIYPCDAAHEITEEIPNATMEPLKNLTAVVSTVNLTANTTGIVVCVGTNIFGEGQAAESIFVSDADGVFSLNGPKSEIIEGDDFELTCAASVYNYTDKLKWFYAYDKPVEENERLKIVNSITPFTYRSTLMIHNVSKKDQNEFRCVGLFNDSMLLNNQYYELIVLDSVMPYFIDSDMNKTDIIVDLNVNKGDIVSLKCRVDGKPSPNVTWYKDDNIIEGNNQFFFSNNNKELDIKFLLEGDDGLYTCRATNRVGEIKHSRFITVKGKGTSRILIGSVVVLVIICAILITIFSIKIHREKVMRKELIEAGLMHFEEGAMECLNPDLTVDDQADLLPYDKKWEFPRERLKLGKQLGSGAFGVVMKAEADGISEDESVTTVAVKMVRKSTDPTYIRALASELKIMVHLGKHLNVVNLLGACTKNIAKRELYVIVEYCRFGNLHNYLLRHRADFINQIDPATGMIDPSIGLDLLTRPTSVSSSNSRLKYAALSFSRSLSVTSAGSSGEPVEYKQGIDSQGVSMSPDGCVMSNNSSQPGWRSNYRGDYKDQNLKPICTQNLLSWAYQVAAGMEYLSRRRVLHGDLAARNILLAENNVVKICDFGLAKSMYKDDNYKKKGDGPLPIKWMAIESIRDRIFSTQSDVWSFGIVLWEFFTLAETPYPGMEAEKQYQKLIEGYRMEQPEYATKEVYEIMTQCWKAKPTLRPTFPDLVESVGNLLEESVKTRFIELNSPYMDMNTLILETGKSDYLTMMSAPDHAALSSAVPDYVNSPVQLTSNNSTYLMMSPTTGTDDSGIFSPRPEVPKSHFEFPSVDKTKIDDSEEAVEMTPMLSKNSDYLEPINVQQRRAEFAKQRENCQNQSTEEHKPESGYTNAPPGTLDKNSMNLNRSLEKDLTDSKNYASQIVRSKNNYINMPKQKSDLRKDPVDSFSNPSYVIINNKDQTKI